MKLTIDNHDGAGVRDYTAWLEPSDKNRIVRNLNQPAQVEINLVAVSPDMNVPTTAARMVLERGDGHTLFTGYTLGSPQFEYLGWGALGPVYRYRVTAISDEAILDRKRVPFRSTFISRFSGDILKQLIADCGGAEIDVSAIDDIEVIPQFSSSSQLTWTQHAQRIALLNRTNYRAHDGAVSLHAMGGNTLLLDEADPNFSPGSFALDSPDRLANDLVVLGRVEPKAYIKDYFIGDGLTLSFNLSHTPFTKQAATLLEDEFSGNALSALRWSIQDPAAAFSVSSGKLSLGGGPGTDGGACVNFVEILELGGTLDLQHGELEVTAASDGVLGGLYSGEIVRANCFAGFSITTSGGVTGIRALVNGSETGSSITTVSGHRYLLSTRIYATEAYRIGQKFHSSQYQASSPRGGGAVGSSARLILEVHHVDPSNPGTIGAPTTVLYDAVLSDIPGYCTYGLVNAGDLHGSLSFTRILRQVDTEVRSTIPSQSPRTRLLGAITEGAECTVTGTNTLIFFSPYVPVPSETIVVRYRSRGRAQARITDDASVASHANSSDDGVRTAVHRVVVPAARTAADCEIAALALLDDSTQVAWSGSYQCWSDFLPTGTDSDPLPGDAVSVVCPSRGAEFTAIIREVEVALRDLHDDRSIYRIKFANDAAVPLSFQLEQGILREDLETVASNATFIASLPAAAITAIDSTSITVDVGVTPPIGGGVEVRRSDFGWGESNDRNLIGRFSTETLTVPRLARIQTYYVRQYDNSSPRKYSRYSTGLHINYPN